MRLPIIDRVYPDMPRSFHGVVAKGYTQDDDYSCGAVVAFTGLQIQRINRGLSPMTLRDYRSVYDVVKPCPERGSSWAAVRRAFGRTATYGRFRSPSVQKALREGNLVIAAIAWPTEEEPDLQHYITITAATRDSFLQLNLAGDPGKSWRWDKWENIRPGGDDTMLVVPL